MKDIMHSTVHRFGFTIVELVVVIAVIAILAVVTIVGYNGVTNRARDNAAKSSALDAGDQLSIYALDNARRYPDDLSVLGISDHDDITYQYRVDNSAVPATFCLTVNVGTASYYVSQADSRPKSGGCPGHSQNGLIAVTNLATNPSFEAGGAAVEVLRNRVGNPLAISGGTAFGAGGGAGSYVSGYIRNTASGTTGHYVFPYPPTGEGTASRYTVTAGQKFSFRAEVRNPNASIGYYRLGVGWYDSAGAGLTGTLVGPLESINAGESRVLEYSGTVPSTAGLTGMLPIVYNSNSVGSSGATTVGWMLDTTNWALYTGSTVPTAPVPFFTGATAAGGDFTYAWVGTANSSASVMRGTSIATYITPGSVATGVRSSEWSASGSTSLRQIPVYTGRGSAYTELASGGTPRGLLAGKTYTIVATCRLAQKQNFTLTGASRSIAIVGTTGGTYNANAMAPDVVGSHVVRLKFTVPPSGPWYLRLYNGGTRGDPDIWWDNLLIVEGDYDGLYGDGSSPNWIWNGPVNASTSTGPTVR